MTDAPTSRIVLITGAANGIGRALARRLGAAGDRLALADLDGQAARAVAAEIGGPDRALPLEVDVTDWPSVERMVAEVVGHFGGLDALVNCAGGFSGLAHPHRRALETLPIEEWDRAFDLNVKSIFLCARAAAPALRASRAGRVVSISSSAARVGAGQAGPAYVASKAAVSGLTRSLAGLFAPDRVTVNAIAPGGTTSERFLAAIASQGDQARGPVRNPLGRHGTPEEMAATIAFLLGDEAAYITGATIDVNGGIWMV